MKFIGLICVFALTSIHWSSEIATAADDPWASIPWKPAELKDPLKGRHAEGSGTQAIWYRIREQKFRDRSEYTYQVWNSSPVPYKVNWWISYTGTKGKPQVEHLIKTIPAQTIAKAGQRIHGISNQRFLKLKYDVGSSQTSTGYGSGFPTVTISKCWYTQIPTEVNPSSLHTSFTYTGVKGQNCWVEFCVGKRNQKGAIYTKRIGFVAKHTNGKFNDFRWVFNPDELPVGYGYHELVWWVNVGHQKNSRLATYESSARYDAGRDENSMHRLYATKYAPLTMEQVTTEWKGTMFSNASTPGVFAHIKLEMYPRGDGKAHYAYPDGDKKTWSFTWKKSGQSVLMRLGTTWYRVNLSNDDKQMSGRSNTDGETDVDNRIEFTRTKIYD